MMRRTLFAVVCLFLLAACSKSRDVHHAFYYWKTDFEISSADSTLLNNLRTDRIYLRCFDVSWNKETKQAVPLAKVSFVHPAPTFIEVVPVIYITNETINEIPPADIPTLAHRIQVLLDDLTTRHKISWSELQLDCDWTESNQKKFFDLVKEIHARIGFDKKMSCTIRLHQVKYPDRTGIPPVDRGMLMYYNMSSLTEEGTRNSIYDPDVAARYVTFVGEYPLPLDLALPVFTWGVHRRSEVEYDLINNLTLDDVRKSGLFREQAPGLFMPLQGCFFRGSYFIDGDQLRVEEINPELCKRAAQQVSPFLKSATFHVAFFHLDSVNTARYGQKSFEDIYSVFD